MAEKRNSCMAFCVKNGATSHKVELFASHQWQGAPAGRYRLRVNRRWMDGPDGAHLYLAPEQLGDALLRLAGLLPEQDDTAPALRRGTRVSVPNGRSIGPIPLRDVTHVMTEAPLRGFDGLWYVGVQIMGRGVVMVPAGEVRMKR